MAGGEWKLLRWLLNKFMSEEERESEHAEGQDITSHGALQAAHTLSQQGRDGQRHSRGVLFDEEDKHPAQTQAARISFEDEYARDGLANDYIGDWPYSTAADRASVRIIDDSGHMHVSDSVLSKAVVSPYLGREINEVMKDAPGWQMLEPKTTYKLLRDPKELRKAADTFNGKPLLWRHQAATATDHPTDIVIGSTGTNARFDGENLTNDLTIWPQYATKAIEDGRKKSLSCGYGYIADMTPGTYNGQLYDGVMRNIKGNHVALVDAPRVPGAQVAGDDADNLLWYDLANALRELAV
jgi:hypothetical protein